VKQIEYNSTKSEWVYIATISDLRHEILQTSTVNNKCNDKCEKNLRVHNQQLKKRQSLVCKQFRSFRMSRDVTETGESGVERGLCLLESHAVVVQPAARFRGTRKSLFEAVGERVVG